MSDNAAAVGRRRPKAYEEVADTLLARIARGQLSDGDRLPGEIGLADEFGVSRATIREALRLLGAQDLIHTSKGAGGGGLHPDSGSTGSTSSSSPASTC